MPAATTSSIDPRSWADGQAQQLNEMKGSLHFTDQQAPSSTRATGASGRAPAKRKPTLPLCSSAGQEDMPSGWAECRRRDPAPRATCLAETRVHSLRRTRSGAGLRPFR